MACKHQTVLEKLLEMWGDEVRYMTVRQTEAFLRDLADGFDDARDALAPPDEETS